LLYAIFILKIKKYLIFHIVETYVAQDTAVCRSPHKLSNQIVGLQTHLLSKCCVHNNKIISCPYILGEKILTCLCVGLLWICQTFSVSYKTVHRWVMTNWCVIHDIFITARKHFNTNFHPCNHLHYYMFYSCVFYRTNRIYKILLLIYIKYCLSYFSC
jgi:hypothetical protein